MNEGRKQHWETVYETKKPEEVSWTQEVPETSLSLIRALEPKKDAAIIDIGGGDSKLVDFLLQEGFQNITVLDISAKAIERAKIRLGALAERVKWVVSDVIDFHPTETYAVWHDRAAFHFLTAPEEIQKYLDLAAQCVSCHLIIGTFSDRGPLKCSGLEISRYSESALTAQLQPYFTKIRCLTVDHVTPFDTTQHFLFCSFSKTK